MNRLLITATAIVLVLSGSLLEGCPGLLKEKPAPQVPKEKPENRQATRKPRVLAAKKPGDYFPLTKGSTWKYQGEGNEYASFTREVLFTKENRAQIREDNGGTLSAIVFKTRAGEVTRIFFRGEAYGETNFLDANPNDNTPILKGPLKRGTKWAEPNGTREIIDVNASVYTPAGTFTKCLKVKITGQDSTLYEYFKDGVGMVKREFISGDNRVTSSLEKYTIK